jgi:hypothetical protein
LLCGPHLLFDVERDFEKERRAGTKLGLDPGIAHRAAGIFVLTRWAGPLSQPASILSCHALE